MTHRLCNVAALAFTAATFVAIPATGQEKPSQPQTNILPPISSLRPEDLVGQWGFGAYHREMDRARAETFARDMCDGSNGTLYVISPAGDGVMMYGHDNPLREKMTLKRNREGKTFIGPGPAPGGADDREIISSDCDILTMKWVDTETAARYGINPLARCSP
jgi:hypothetical protein